MSSPDLQKQLVAANLRIETLQRLLKQKNGTPDAPADEKEQRVHRVVCMVYRSFWNRFLVSAAKLGFKNASELLRGTMQDVIDAAKE